MTKSSHNTSSYFAFVCPTNKELQIIMSQLVWKKKKNSELSSGFTEAQNLIHRFRKYLLGIYRTYSFGQDNYWKTDKT